MAVTLFDSIAFGPYTLPNRIVMSPMTRNRAPAETPTALNALYYGQRATAGLVITESTAISPRGLGWPEAPGIYTEAQVAGWSLVTDAVHRAGGRIYLQLWHCGRSSHPLTQPEGALPLGPSALPCAGTVRTRNGRLPLVVPREATAHDIATILNEYRSAARNAQDAGFDGVEIHAGNGFLLDQFLKDSANVRTDGYGGSAQNRCRLLFEAVGAVAEVWGPTRVGVRLSPTNPSNFELSDHDPAAVFGAALDGLNRLQVCFVDVVEGSSNALPALADVDWASHRARFGGIYIANNAQTQATAMKALASGRADMVAFGRAFIANPDLVRRLALNVPLNTVNQETVYAKDATGYTDYPFLDVRAATARLTVFSTPTNNPLETRMIKSILGSVAALMLVTGAHAQQTPEGDYPTKPITIIVPYAAGGGADLIARTVGNAMSHVLRQPIVYDNRTGASGMIAAAMVAKAPADGYTLLLMTDNMYTTNPRFFGKKAEDSLAGLDPVSNLVSAPVVIAVGGTSSLRSIVDLVAFAKAKGAPLSYATPGIGTPHQLAAELLARSAGVQFIHVPYKGTAGAMTDLISGRLDLLFGMQATVQPLADAGKVRIVAVTPAQRFPLLPSVPSVSEAFSGSAVSAIDIGLVVPRGTPAQIVRKLNEGVQKALADPDVRAVMRTNGMVAAGDSAADYRQRMKDARQERESAIETTGIKVEQ